MGRKTEPKTILITRFSALGDVAMTLPVIYGACSANPDKTFVMLTRKLPAKLFLCPPPNLKVAGVDLNSYKGVSGLKRLLDEMISQYGIDSVVDLHDVIRTQIIRTLAALKGLHTSHINKGRRARKALTRSNKKTVVQLTPMPDRYREAFHRLHIDVSDSFRTLFTSGKAPADLFRHPSIPAKAGETWLAIAPFAAHAGKIYPLHLMEKIVDHYAAIPGMRIFILGAGKEEQM